MASTNLAYGEEIARLTHAKELTQSAMTRGGKEVDFSKQLSKIESVSSLSNVDSILNLTVTFFLTWKLILFIQKLFSWKQIDASAFHQNRPVLYLLFGQGCYQIPKHDGVPLTSLCLRYIENVRYNEVLALSQCQKHFSLATARQKFLFSRRLVPKVAGIDVKL